MQVLSKPIDEKTSINYNIFTKKNIDLKKYKIPELKKVAKYNNLKVGGTKPILLERILEHFNKIKNIIVVQSLIRRKLVYMYINYKGPALYNKTKCVNETDFYTLEPLEDIELYDFFSFEDANNFLYGFDINSLLTMMKKPGIMTNPYNREKLSYDILKKASFVGKMNKILLSKKKMSFDETINMTRKDEIIENMRKIRNDNINNRINNLFYEFDNLGNYTTPLWISNLNIHDYLNLIRYIYDIWTYRGNMPILTKRRICPYFNPFIDGLESINMRIPANAQNIEIVKRTCITIMENLVYTGINNDFKQIATLHILTAISHVSDEARNSLPYLYESISF
jgi:hypothetical protein